MANDIGFVNESIVAQDNSDNSVNTAVGIADSGNIASGNSATDSFNSDSSTNTAIGVDVDATDNSNTATDSFNDNSTNVADSGNDNSTNDSSTNVDFDATDNSNTATDSFNDYSDNLAVDIADSFNDNSDNSDNSWNDNSTNIAIDASDNSVNDSYNTDNSDNSVNAGVRQYNTGTNFDGGAHIAAAGSLHVNSSSTIVDQSVNSNIVAGDNVVIGSSSSAVVASAEGAVAAGGNVDASVNLDQSTNIGNGASGDVNVGNETYTQNIVGSFNDFSDNSVNTWNSIDVDIDDSFNSWTSSVDVADSFNTADLSFTEFNTDIDVTEIVDNSINVALAGDDINF